MIQEQKIVVCPACPWEGYWTDDRTPPETVWGILRHCVAWLGDGEALLVKPEGEP
jgi:hypothetical protein